MVNLKKFTKSFYYAGRGLTHLWETEQNFRMEVVGIVVFSVLLFFFEVGWIKIILISFLFLIILLIEIVNTIFERITDFLTEINHLACANVAQTSQKKVCHDEREILRNVKDLGAAAVLVIGAMSFLITLAIFFKI